jgi:hypothetical protein
MALADALAAGPSRGFRGPECAVGRILRILPPEEADALRVMIALDSPWHAEEVGRLLRDEHHIAVAGQTINRHKRGGCQCSR